MRSALEMLLLLLLLGTPAAPRQSGPGTANRQAGDSLAAISRLRALYWQRDYEGAAEEGQALVARYPGCPELRAWWVAALAGNGDGTAAALGADSLRRRWPASAWTAFAGGVALQQRRGSNLATRDSLLRAHALAPADTDLLAVFALAQAEIRPVQVVELADWAAAHSRLTAPLLAAKARALGAPPLIAEEGVDSARRAGALEAARQAVAVDSLSVDAWLELAARLPYGDSAYEALRRAVRSAPLAIPVHQRLWLMAAKRPDWTSERRQREVAGDAEALLAARGSPSTVAAVADALERVGLSERRRQLEDRLLAEFPTSAATERVLSQRLMQQLNAAGALPPDSARAAYAEVRRQADAFLRRPAHQDSSRLALAWGALFQALAADSAAPVAELVRAIEGRVRVGGPMSAAARASGAVALADRKVRLPLAERLAREAVSQPAGEASLPGSILFSAGSGQAAEARAHDALGWVLLARGRTAQAARELRRAQRLDTANLDVLTHLGRAEARAGRLAAAESLFARRFRGALAEESRPSRTDLATVYRRRHGTLHGFDAYVARLLRADREQRRSAILASRQKSPRALPGFRLRTLDGATFPSDSLTGKVAVIDFWGVWCGPCVAEMPQIQKLRDHYRDTTDVVVLTIDLNDPPERVREFIATRKYDLPVLMDDGYVMRSGVNSFPTTWFLDRQGGIAFVEERGNQGDGVYEEALWRVEALRAEGKR